MHKFKLSSHSSTQCPVGLTVQVTVELTDNSDLRLQYELSGDITKLIIPTQQTSQAKDYLWQHTCFELFVAAGNNPGYHEFNFSPSGQWAAYAFRNYRETLKWSSHTHPKIHIIESVRQLQLNILILAIDLPEKTKNQPLRLGLSAVIEGLEGDLSYWALHHPASKPDFHDRSSFACTLTTA